DLKVGIRHHHVSSRSVFKIADYGRPSFREGGVGGLVTATAHEVRLTTPKTRRRAGGVTRVCITQVLYALSRSLLAEPLDYLLRHCGRGPEKIFLPGNQQSGTVDVLHRNFRVRITHLTLQRPIVQGKYRHKAVA